MHKLPVLLKAGVQVENKATNVITEKLLSALGLAKRAGKLSIGAELTLEKIRAGACVMAFAAGDISNNSDKKLRDAANYRNVRYIRLDTDKKTLAVRLGKEGYAVACGLCDESFANLINKILSEEIHNS